MGKGKGKNEVEMDGIACEHHDDVDASTMSSTTVEDMRKQDGEETEEVEDKQEEEEGRGGAAGGVTSSTQTKDPSPSRAASEANVSKVNMLSKVSSGKIPTREPEQLVDSRESGRVAPGDQRHTRQQKAGCKRGRPRASGSAREKGAGGPLSVSVGALREATLSRAGVPWECYLAYAELKRRQWHLFSRLVLAAARVLR